MIEGEVIEGSFEVVNKQTDRPLVVIQIVTGCGCTTVEFDYAPIAPRGRRRVTYRFDSRGQFGQQFKSIEVISAQRQVATVYLQGQVDVQ